MRTRRTYVCTVAVLGLGAGCTERWLVAGVKSRLFYLTFARARGGVRVGRGLEARIRTMMVAVSFLF